MNRRAAILALAATLVVAASLFAAGESCEGVRSMSIPDACIAAARTNLPLRRRCLETLHSPINSKVSTYAAVATEAAADLCAVIWSTVRVLLQGDRASPPNNRWKMVLSGCYGDLVRAHQAMAAAEDQLRRCVFVHLVEAYGEAMAAVEHCAAKLAAIGQAHLRQMVAGDMERLTLASRLGALAAGHP